MSKLFIYKFQSQSGLFYIYDVNTSQFLCVDKITYDVMDDYALLPIGDIISKWANKYCKSDIKNTLKAIEFSRKKGFFLANGFKKMMTPYSQEYLKESISSAIGFMTLNITKNCNMRCKYCSFSGSYFYERHHSSESMTKKVIEKTILYYLTHSKNSPAKSISFYGGEPLTEFDKIVYSINILSNFKHNAEYRRRIDTNGILLGNQEIIDFIWGNNFSLQVSLDGPIESHDKYRRDVNDRPTFLRIMNNLNLLRKSNESFYNKHISFAITFAPRHNLLKINDFFEKEPLVKGHSFIVSAVRWEDTTFFERFSEEDFLIRKRQIEKLKERYISARINNKEPTSFEKGLFEKKLMLIHARAINEKFQAISMNGCCIPGLRRIFVDTDGKFYPCERVGNAYNIGDIDMGLDINKINEVVDNYIEQSEADCLKCWGLKLCSVCFSYARKGNEFSLERKRERCRRALRVLHDDFVTYATILERNSQAFDFVRNTKFS